MSSAAGSNSSWKLRLPYVSVTISKKRGGSTLAGNSFSSAHNSSTGSAVDCQSQSTNYSIYRSNQIMKPLTTLPGKKSPSFALTSVSLC